jgi:purine nucleoside phosphorylase
MGGAAVTPTTRPEGTIRIGVIGGSGLYEMEGLIDIREERLTTPFGDPSDDHVISVDPSGGSTRARGR